MRIVIYGAGGLGRQLRRQVLRDTERLGWAGPAFADDSMDRPATLLGLPVIHPSTLQVDDRCIIAVGNGLARQRIAGRCPGFHVMVATTAIVDDGVEIGAGSIVCDHVTLTADSETVLGRHVICNFQSYVGHDCRIGDFVTLAPRVGVNGNVRIERGATIGAGALIRNGTPARPLVVGEGCVVGMGAVVIEDVPPFTTVVGNPARPQSSAGCF